MRSNSETDTQRRRLLLDDPGWRGHRSRILILQAREHGAVMAASIRNTSLSAAPVRPKIRYMAIHSIQQRDHQSTGPYWQPSFQGCLARRHALRL